MREPRIRLAELIAALSFAADLGMGYPMEQMLRAALVATRLAEQMRLPQCGSSCEGKASAYVKLLAPSTATKISARITTAPLCGSTIDTVSPA